MSRFTLSTYPLSTVLYVHTEQASLQIDPDYQREGDVWTPEKRQLLVDSIINGYDIPKIYFHKFLTPKKVGSRSYTHAVVDGKQRLLSIWQFIEGDFPLNANFEYLHDAKVSASGMTYAELARAYPRLKLRFDSYALPIVVVETDDIELIEDMFSRLNEAVPLTAAEKRNAFRGPLPKTIRKIAKDAFFTKHVPFPNKRYRHYDLAAKFLLIEEFNGTADTKKAYLDDLVVRWETQTQKAADQLGASVSKILRRMSACFVSDDPLLRSIGMIVVYYHLFRIAISERWVSDVTRQKVERFEALRAENRTRAEKDLARADYDLLEFDRLAQSPNDSFATAARLKVMLKKQFSKELPKDYTEKTS